MKKFPWQSSSRFASRDKGSLTADPPERKEGRYKQAADVAENGIGSVVEAMAPKFTNDERLQSVARASMQKQSPAAYIGALKAMAERLDSTEVLASFSRPVVIVHGDADVLIPIDRAREAKSILPQSHLVELSSVGHMPMLESPEDTAGALKHLAK